jgi:hypothetical protein
LVVSRRRVLEAVFILLEFPSPSRRIFIGSHSLPSSLVRRIGPSLRARDLLRDIEQDGHEVYNSRQVNLGAALAALGQLEDTPAVRHLQDNLRVTTAQVDESGPG